jgi:hypothetical protein
MEPILVPRPPKESFNKDRLISDLVRNQVEHFKHVEESLPQNVRATIPQHAIVTESDAARYIHAMTSYLLSRPQPKQPAKAVAAKPPTPIRPRRPLTLAAAATPVLKKSTAKKKSPAKKETPAAKRSGSIKPKARKTTSTKRKK